jgi:Cu/Zn superoxide dismutase
VARLRKAAVAAVALSTLALTSSAVSAHAQTGSSSEGSEESSMSWGYSSVPLTDLSPNTNDVFDGGKATAMMVGVGGSSYFRVKIYGLKESAIGERYGAHLHEKQCVAGDGAAAGPHYNITPFNSETNLFEVISDRTEVWLDFKVDSEANSRTTANVPFVPKPGDRSIVLHAKTTLRESDGTNPAGWASTRLACVPFKIKSYSR